MWNVERSPFRLMQSKAGITVRRAVGAVALIMWKKRMPSVAGRIEYETLLNRKLEIFGFQEVGADFHEVFCCVNI
mgnify:CR=1 FL=1